MELRHLRYFAAVAGALNITQAAARLRVAQPALSRQLQDLEDEIGVDLLKRSPRGVVLTAEGRLFLDAVRDILARVDAAVEQARALARGEAGELRVGYSPSPTIEVLPPALAAFREAAPRVSVVLEDLATSEMWAGLRSGTLELAVSSRPLEESATGLEFELLRRYPIGVALAPGHAWARRRAVSIEELAGETLIAFRRREYADYHRLLKRVLGAHHARAKIVAESDGASSLITAVESGRGVSVLPAIFGRVAGPRLKFRPLAPQPQPLEVGLTTAVGGDLTPAGEKLRALLRAQAKR
jgi:DNA-binding transcriptional LysR family regulator